MKRTLLRRQGPRMFSAINNDGLLGWVDHECPALTAILGAGILPEVKGHIKRLLAVWIGTSAGNANCVHSFELRDKFGLAKLDSD